MKSKLLLAVLLIASLVASAAPAKDQLIGHWRYSGDTITAEYTFRGNGTFTGKLTENGKVAWVYAGRWSLAGDTINYAYTESSIERIPVGTTDRDRLIEVTKDHYVIEATNGSRHKYSRVP